MGRIRRYLVAGILFWLPVWVTLLVIGFFIKLLDKSLELLPTQYQPEQLLGFRAPGIGILVAIFLFLLTGMLVSNFIGHRLMRIWDKLVGRIPLVRSIYLGVKQVLHTLFHTDSLAFRRVLLLEYPRKGLWSIAFQTSIVSEQINDKSGEELLAIFVPTTPNPTSGFLIMVPESEVIELDLTVEQALKMVISLGVAQPGMNGNGVADLPKVEQ